MAYKIPYHRETFQPETAIKDNRKSDAPVEFELSMAAGADHARLKSVIAATIGLSANLPQWTPQMQEAVAEAFRTGPQLFVNTVGKIRNLSAPAALCRQVGIRVDDKAADEADIPVTTGKQFSLVAPYMPDLALELAFEIQRLTVQGAIDTRFTERPSGSPAKPAATNGSASAAPSSSGADATAEKPM